MNVWGHQRRILTDLPNVVTHPPTWEQRQGKGHAKQRGWGGPRRNGEGPSLQSREGCGQRGGCFQYPSPGSPANKCGRKPPRSEAKGACSVSSANPTCRAQQLCQPLAEVEAHRNNSVTISYPVSNLFQWGIRECMWVDSWVQWMSKMSIFPLLPGCCGKRLKHTPFHVFLSLFGILQTSSTSILQNKWPLLSIHQWITIARRCWVTVTDIANC